MVRIWLLCLLIFSFFVFSCNEKTPTEAELTFFDVQGENGFVGKVTGTNAFIAILSGDTLAVVYICNGDEQISEWFIGVIDEPTEINLVGITGAQISAQFTKDSFSGEVTLGSGTTHIFSATPNGTGDTGIFRVMGDQAATDEVDAGWIRNFDGEVKGAFRIHNAFRQTPALPNANFAVNSKSYPVFQFQIRRPPIQPSGGAPPFVPIPYPNLPPADTTKTGG